MSDGLKTCFFTEDMRVGGSVNASFIVVATYSSKVYSRSEASATIVSNMFCIYL